MAWRRAERGRKHTPCDRVVATMVRVPEREVNRAWLPTLFGTNPVRLHGWCSAGRREAVRTTHMPLSPSAPRKKTHTHGSLAVAKDVIYRPQA